MKILSDFDGVLTAHDAEAAAVADRLTERALEALEGDEIRAHALLEGLRAVVRAEAAAHGWFSGDRIACYADEDPYVFNNAVCRAIYAQGPAELRERLRALGFASDEALATACFDEGTARWRARGLPHVLDEALGAIQTFFANGAEVVIVSNSSNERIESILKPTGITRWGAGKLRIRGGARKNHVGGDRPADVPASADFGGREVFLRRASYYDIIRDEQPDVVIGDVLSLDLALPAVLRARSADFEELEVVLKRHPHTPRWALEACAAHGIRTVESIARLPGLLKL